MALITTTATQANPGGWHSHGVCDVYFTVLIHLIMSTNFIDISNIDKCL
jgi:hypothetical protein